MALHINDDSMPLDDSGHTARKIGDGWVVSWLPRRVLSRDQAISGMTLAETVCTDTIRGPARLQLLDTLAAELGMTGIEAVCEITAADDRYDGGSHVNDDQDDEDADDWDDGQVSSEALIPAAIAISLPIALTPISPLAATLSLLVSVRYPCALPSAAVGCHGIHAYASFAPQIDSQIRAQRSWNLNNRCSERWGRRGSNPRPTDYESAALTY
jgi:hypothetical protein